MIDLIEPPIPGHEEASNLSRRDRYRLGGVKPSSSQMSALARNNDAAKLLPSGARLKPRKVVMSTPGDTPGHQVLVVKLAKRGPVVLAGDLYHYPEERATGRIPTFEFNADQSKALRAKVEVFLKQNKAELWDRVRYRDAREAAQRAGVRPIVVFGRLSRHTEAQGHRECPQVGVPGTPASAFEDGLFHVYGSSEVPACLHRWHGL